MPGSTSVLQTFVRDSWIDWIGDNGSVTDDSPGINHIVTAQSSVVVREEPIVPDQMQDDISRAVQGFFLASGTHGMGGDRGVVPSDRV